MLINLAYQKYLSNKIILVSVNSIIDLNSLIMEIVFNIVDLVSFKRSINKCIFLS